MYHSLLSQGVIICVIHVRITVGVGDAGRSCICPHTASGSAQGAARVCGAVLLYALPPLVVATAAVVVFMIVVVPQWY
jgi:hypothetical protein